MMMSVHRELTCVPRTAKTHKDPTLVVVAQDLPWMPMDAPAVVSHNWEFDYNLNWCERLLG